MSQDLEWMKTVSLNGSWEWGSRFCNIPLNCNYFVFDIMSRHLADNPQIRLICELGSCTGGMSIYLGLEAVRMGIPCHTWDIIKQVTKDTNTILEKLGVEQHIFDVFEYQDKVIELISKQPTYLLCDGGDKPREMNTFIKHLPPGSLVSCHDVGREVFDKDILPIYETVKMLPLRSYEWNEKNVQLMTWKILENKEL